MAQPVRPGPPQQPEILATDNVPRFFGRNDIVVVCEWYSVELFSPEEGENTLAHRHVRHSGIMV